MTGRIRYLAPLIGLWLVPPMFAADSDQVKCGPNQDRVWVYDSLNSFDIETRLKCGDSVDIISRVRGYVEIRTASGMKGYVPDTAFPDLPPLPPDDNDKPLASVIPRHTSSTSALASSTPPAPPFPVAPPPTVAPKPVSVAMAAAPVPAVSVVATAPQPPPVASIAPVATAPANVSTSRPSPQANTNAPVTTVIRVKIEPDIAPAPQPPPVVTIAPAAAVRTTPQPSPAANADAPITAAARVKIEPAVAAAPQPAPVPVTSKAVVTPVTPSAPPKEFASTISVSMKESDVIAPSRDLVTQPAEKVVPESEDYPDTQAQNESEDPACRIFFSAYGLTPSQYKWLADNRRKQFAEVCPAPDLGRVDYVVLFTHDSDVYADAMPTAIHTDRNGFSDFSPTTAVDTALISPSDADRARYEFVWVFRMQRGNFDPAKFSPRRRPQFNTEAKGSHASARTLEDAFHFMETQNPNR